jgi:recombination protein RecR
MQIFSEPLQKLIAELTKLPGIGKKSAQRIAFHLLKAPKEEAQHLAEAITEVQSKLKYCPVCSNITDADLCAICADTSRDRRTICVVEEPNNIIPVEKSGSYRGLYHVLQGALAPLHGVGPENLRIRELLERLKSGEVTEIIIATNPTAEGEATAIYLSRLIKPLGVRVSRIGMGLPMGSDLEYADEVTVGKALEGRKEI